MQLTHSTALDFGRDTLPITIFAKQYDKESRFVENVPLECGGTARYAWLRSPYPSYANNARIVNSSGRVSSGGAYIGFGVAPACLFNPKIFE